MLMQAGVWDPLVEGMLGEGGAWQGLRCSRMQHAGKQTEVGVATMGRGEGRGCTEAGWEDGS